MEGWFGPLPVVASRAAWMDDRREGGARAAASDVTGDVAAELRGVVHGLPVVNLLATSAIVRAARARCAATITSSRLGPWPRRHHRHRSDTRGPDRGGAQALPFLHSRHLARGILHWLAGGSATRDAGGLPIAQIRASTGRGSIHDHGDRMTR
jgi:hypothetical protein